jgi:hypothetical protein
MRSRSGRKLLTQNALQSKHSSHRVARRPTVPLVWQSLLNFDPHVPFTRSACIAFDDAIAGIRFVRWNPRIFAAYFDTRPRVT